MKLKIVTSIILFVNIYQLNAQTVYGLNGLIKIPDAYMIENGNAAFSVEYFYDNAMKTPGKCQYNIPHFSYSFLVGVISRLEVGYCRLAILDVEKIKFNPRNFHVDQMFNCKFLLIKERRNIPQFSVGIQDIVGTRMYQSFFVVSSKRFVINNYSSVYTTMGYGTRLMDLVSKAISTEKARDCRFIGFFGGVEGHIAKYFSILGEYDANNWNFGMVLRYKSFVKVKFLVTKFDYWGGQISLKAAI